MKRARKRAGEVHRRRPVTMSRQEHGGPEQAEIVRLNQGRGQVRDGQDELVGIETLDMVGADVQVLLEGEEAPGEVTQQQARQGQAQAEEAAPEAGRPQPDQGQGRGQDHRGGQGRAFIFAPGHAGQKEGGQGQAAPGGLLRQPQVDQARGAEGEIGQGQVGVGDVEVDHEDRAV